jgi:hypothetical protein
MHAVVLSFPGHFFQTQLCVQRLLEFYPEINRVTLVLDDVDLLGWHGYVQDVEAWARDAVPVPLDIKRTSEFGFVSQFVSGWWRQQIVKYCVDVMVSGHEWFVVDGDTIFETRCSIQQCVPISYRNDLAAGFTKMTMNYVRTLLGTSQGALVSDHTQVCTNAIPFRCLDREFLVGLRSFVSDRFHQDFVQLHHDWCQDQTIVADWVPPDRMVMSEWELMECYRKYVLDIDWPMVELGSGYPVDVDLDTIGQKTNLFRHAYRRDAEIPAEWFEQQGVTVLPEVWCRAVSWYQQQQEINRT